MAAVRATRTGAGVARQSEADLVSTQKLVADKFLPPQQSTGTRARDGDRARVAELNQQVRSRTFRREATDRSRAPGSKSCRRRAQRGRVGGSTRSRIRSGQWADRGYAVLSRRMGHGSRLRGFAAAPGQRKGALLFRKPSWQTSRTGAQRPFAATPSGARISGRCASFVAPQAEYTPPVIYSRENRANLVFLVEARRLPPFSSSLVHTVPALAPSFRGWCLGIGLWLFLPIPPPPFLFLLFSASSAPTAAARPPRSACSAACSRPTRAAARASARHPARERRDQAPRRLHDAAVQPLRRPVDRGEPRLRRARVRRARPQAPRSRATLERLGLTARASSSPARSPAAGSSGSRSPPACCTSRSCCCSTSRPRASTRRRAASSGTRSTRSRRRASRCSSAPTTWTRRSAATGSPTSPTASCCPGHRRRGHPAVGPRHLGGRPATGPRGACRASCAGGRASRWSSRSATRCT